MFETFIRGERIYQVIEECEVRHDTQVRLRDIFSGHVLPSWHTLRKTGMEEPPGYTFYDQLNFGEFPTYMVSSPRDNWASLFTCPKHGMCTDAMVTTKKTCAVDAKNGQCDKGLVRERTNRLDEHVEG